MIRYATAAVVTSMLSTVAHAQQPTCILQAIEKKLAGPTRTNFMTRCEADVQSVCENLAAQRRLEEPARTLFINNCLNAYVGPR
jgi:hypothetical protein